MNFEGFSQTLLEFMKTEAQRPPRTFPSDNNDVHQPMVTSKITNRPLLSKTCHQHSSPILITQLGSFTNQFKLNLNTFLVYFHLFSDKSIFNLTWCFTYSNYHFNISYCSILFDHNWRWNCL